MNTVKKFTTCVGSCNTINNLSNKASISNKTEDLNISVSNMMACVNESKK